jgi:hypothetical protein
MLTIVLVVKRNSGGPEDRWIRRPPRRVSRSVVENAVFDEVAMHSFAF